MNELHKEVEDVKIIMQDNVQKIIDNTDNLELIEDKTEDLANHSNRFKKSAIELRNKIWCQNLKVTLITVWTILAVLSLIIFIIVLSLQR